jgi:hypothetical protein
MANTNVTLELSSDEALVFFEWLARFNEPEQPPVPFADDAEKHVLWRLEGQLEKVLVEPFGPNYEALLAKARANVRDSAQATAAAALLRCGLEHGGGDGGFRRAPSSDAVADDELGSLEYVEVPEDDVELGVRAGTDVDASGGGSVGRGVETGLGQRQEPGLGRADVDLPTCVLA